jgi:hypothetical protein
MRKIQVFPALQHMLKLISLNWKVIAKFAWPWLALTAALSAFPKLAITSLNAITPMQAIPLVVGYIASCSIAVSWHRYILLDEMSLPFKLDRPVWNYALRSTIIGLICFIPLLALAEIFNHLPDYFVPLGMALSIFILIILMRLLAGAVASALNTSPISFQNSLAATKGNNWSILGLLASNVLLTLVVIFTFAIIISVIAAIMPAIARPVELLFSIPMQFAVMLLNASFFTTLYGYFFEGRDL